MRELNENDLCAVTGGTAAAAPTGSVVYTCPNCGTVISASSRDTSVTCPNVRCRTLYQVENGKLVSTMKRPTPPLKPAGV